MSYMICAKLFLENESVFHINLLILIICIFVEGVNIGYMAPTTGYGRLKYYFL